MRGAADGQQGDDGAVVRQAVESARADHRDPVHQRGIETGFGGDLHERRAERVQRDGHPARRRPGQRRQQVGGQRQRDQRPAFDPQHPVAHQIERRHRGHDGPESHQTGHAQHRQRRGVGSGVDRGAQRRQPLIVARDQHQNRRDQRHDHRPDPADRRERNFAPARLGQETGIETGQHQHGHGQIDQDHHHQREDGDQNAGALLAMLAVPRLGRIERTGGRGPLAHDRVIGGGGSGIGGDDEIAVTLTRPARALLRKRQPPHAEDEHDEGRDDTQAGRGEGRGAEERHGDRVLNRGRARQGGHGEGRGAERDGGRHQAAWDVGRAKQRLRHRPEHEEGDEQTHAPVGDQRAGQHDRQHGAARPERLGHEASDGRDRAAVVHELPEHGAEQEQREELGEKAARRSHEGLRPARQERFARRERDDQRRHWREHQDAPAAKRQPN